MLSLEERLWNRIEKKGENECWVWTGFRREGYGRIIVNGKVRNAHRILWVILHGDIPEKMLVCHHCDNRACCNPKHLFLGTDGDNMRDMVNKGRQYLPRCTGSKHGRSKLTEETVVEIRKLYVNGISQQKLATIYNVTQTAISCVCLYKTWRHV
jgi:hypothetical protein